MLLRIYYLFVFVLVYTCILLICIFSYFHIENGIKNSLNNGCSLFYRTVKSSVTETVLTNPSHVNHVRKLKRKVIKLKNQKRKTDEKAEKVDERGKETNTGVTEKIVKTKQTKVNTFNLIILLMPLSALVFLSLSTIAWRRFW